MSPTRSRDTTVVDHEEASPPRLDRADGAHALALAEAVEAEAEAEVAEALAVAAQARASEVRLRRAAAIESDGSDDEANCSESPCAEDTLQASATTRRRRLVRRPTRRATMVAMGIVIVCAMLGASGFVVWRHADSKNEEQRAAEFAAAARQSVVTLMSMDFAHAKDDVQRVIDHSTGSFKDDFVKQSSDFIATVEQSKITTVCTVNATAIKSIANDSAVVLVGATSEVTNAAGAKQDPRAWRLVVTVARDAGQLKLSKVEFVP